MAFFLSKIGICGEEELQVQSFCCSVSFSRRAVYLKRKPFINGSAVFRIRQ